MLESSNSEQLKYWYFSVVQKIENVLNHKYWRSIVVFISVLMVFIFTYPPQNYSGLEKSFVACKEGCVDFQAKIDRADHLLNPKNYPPAYHMAKTQFRITVPLLAKLTSIRSKVGIYIIQCILGIVFFYTLVSLIYQHTKDKVVSLLVTLSTSFMYAGKAAFIDTSGYTDAFAYTFLLLGLLRNNGFFMFFCLLLAYFTDERAIIVSPLVFLFHFYFQLKDKRTTFQNFYRLDIFTVFVIFSWITLFIIRFFLTKFYGFYTPHDDANSINTNLLGYNFWTGIQGFWIFVVIWLIILWLKNRYLLIILLVLSFLAILITSSMVFDVTRSIAYVFPFFIMSVCFLSNSLPKNTFRVISMLVCLICFLYPDDFYLAYNGQCPALLKGIHIKILDRLVYKI